MEKEKPLKTYLDTIVEEEIRTIHKCAEEDCSHWKAVKRIAERAFRHGVERLHQQGCDGRPNRLFHFESCGDIQPAPAEEKCCCSTPMCEYGCKCTIHHWAVGSNRRRGERRKGGEQVHAGSYQHLFGGLWLWSRRRTDRTLKPGERYGDRRKP